MADAGLFDAAAYQVTPAPVEKVSADRRRTLRQAAALAAGRHPLGLALGRHLPLHPDAPPADDRQAAGPRCGSCWHRQVLGHHNRSYGKCTADDGGRISNGAGTDVRRWWPGCRDYSPGDPQLSVDAARFVPEAVGA
ncbi:hypothetical protein C1I95_33300 [Micromonospora craterilacus]|uniref:Uncharacterized protein n=1 Tax=Micromonospora craterilacus TaxID=1655439 RepID=A0A2W2E420_9ACTN|nr:hypothetical protein [Micromonospora craterilacus]PZG04387.1 hypothetical protein C1I95_33300 [Micromonospora craterilacus]